MPEAGMVTNPTDPTPPVNPPEPAAAAPAVADPGKPPTEPAPGEGSLLGTPPAEGDSKPTDPNAPKDPVAPVGAPEKYEFKDADKFDATVLGSFAEAAKEANLPQDVAQKVLDKVAPVLAERRAAQEAAVVTGWVESAKTDKEFGGEKIKENMATALKAVDALYPDAKAPETVAIRELLNGPLGNNPDVIRLLFRAGKAISEDKFVVGKQTTATPSPEAVFYPTMTKK